MKNTLNRLAVASSPYLQQHAGNPVDWYEWGEEALNRAVTENKPLIISIGYSACHWCHVMAHESFMDPDVARFMNSHFVCIKIDREERPDIDQVYMDAAQQISGRGGWPLNAFAMPDTRPFFAATYFPRDQWLELLKKIDHIYVSQIQELGNQADSLTEAIRVNPFIEAESSGSLVFTKTQYESLFSSWENLIDHQAGGFTTVPKFPLPVAWEFLLQYYYLTKNEKVLQSVNFTLQAMAKGGIYDQAGGGFARYSTDKHWKVPHFEKMLYDNAQLVSLYAHAFQVTRDNDYAIIVEHTLNFIGSELMSPEGGVYSSLDADSEGEEGLYYTWSSREMEEVLDASELSVISAWYQVCYEGNWEQGRNILYSNTSKAEFAREHNLLPETFSALLNHANNKLLQARQKRIAPSRDEKIITAWNALMLTAWLDAYKALGKKLYLDKAIKNATFIEENMLRKNDNLWRSYRNGKASIDGFLDDFAFFADACIKLYESTLNLHWLELSRRLAIFVIFHFTGSNESLFFYTCNLSDPLIARKCEVTDNVIPASNSVMARVLFQLGHYYDNAVYTNRALQMLGKVEKKLAEGGPYYANWALLLGTVVFPIYEVAIVGEKATEKSQVIQRNYLPDSLFLGGTNENLPLLKNKLVINKTLIYVCHNKSCSNPVEDVDDALAIIAAG